MPKYATSVRFLVKEGEVDAFVAACETNPKYGEISSYIVKTGDLTFVWNAIFESEQALIDARPGMISNLDRLRGYLQEISPELGVTDPVSGPIIDEK